MKKIISWIIILLFLAIFSFFWNKYNWAKNIAEYLQVNDIIKQTQYVDEFQKKLREDYPETWIEIQDFTLDNISLRFAHVFYWKTFVCTSWKLFAEYKWEIYKIYSHDIADSPITPCTFNVEQTDDENIFLIDFCLAPGWWSWECLGQEMYYNFTEKTWEKWKLFYPEYPNGVFEKTEITRDNINFESDSAYSRVFLQDLWIFE